MKKIKTYVFVTVLAALSLGVVSAGFGVNDKPVEKTAKAENKTAKKEMTKDEVLAQLKNDLSKNPEVLNMLPDLKAEKDKEGNLSYTFRGAGLDGLAKDDLDKLSVRVRQALVKIRTDRIQRQLDNIRQAQRLQNVTPPSIPATPPKVPTPPAQSTSYRK